MRNLSRSRLRPFRALSRCAGRAAAAVLCWGCGGGEGKLQKAAEAVAPKRELPYGGRRSSSIDWLVGAPGEFICRQSTTHGDATSKQSELEGRRRREVR